MEDDVLLSGYIRRLFAPEDEVLEQLRYEIARRELPEIYVSAEVGRLLQVLVRAIGARRVLEIGTLGGYSAIWMARALPPNGRLITLEIDPARAELARRFIERAGLDGVVEVRVGDAVELLPSFDSSEPFDAVFIDADKESYPRYLDHALRLVRPGGLILGDNALWSGRVLDDESEDESTRGVRAFNERMAGEARLLSTIIPIRDGVAVGVVG